MAQGRRSSCAATSQLSGKGRVFINNQPATVAVLKALAPHLAVVHAQNQAILIFDPPERLALLDAAAGITLEPVAEAYARAGRKFRAALRN